MQKKILTGILFIFLLAGINAYYTDVQIYTVDEVIPISPFWHWVVMEWEYTGPLTGDDSWAECDFESPDKNYGIFLDLSSPYVSSTGQEFGPTTRTPDCQVNTGEGYIKCTTRTTYFFELQTSSALPAGSEVTVPIKMQGKCGYADPNQQPFDPEPVIVGVGKYGAPGNQSAGTKEKEKKPELLFDYSETYPTEINYDYVFTVNRSYYSDVPYFEEIQSRWGKTNETRNAVINITAIDGRGDDLITGTSFIVPADCQPINTTQEGQDTITMETELELSCEQTGPKLIVVYATNNEGLSGFQGFFSYFSSNDNEVELNLVHGNLLEVFPNIISGSSSGADIIIEQSGNNYDFRLGGIPQKTFTVLKDTGNGIPSEPSITEDMQLNLVNSTPFVSVLEPECPLLDLGGSYVVGQYYKYEGEDFALISRSQIPWCQPGNHKLRITQQGEYSNGNPYTLTQDYNFVVLDININVDGMEVQTENLVQTAYGIVYGEDGEIDLNLTINNYSPEFTEISDVDFYFSQYAQAPNYAFAGDECTSDTTSITAVSDTEWKISSHLECTGIHRFYPIIYLSDFTEPFIFPGQYYFYITESEDKFKMDSIEIENLYDATWNPESGEYCNPKTGDCYATETPEGTGQIGLPQGTIKITKGDLLRFYATITNVYHENLEAEVKVVITDESNNVVAELEQNSSTPTAYPSIEAYSKKVFDVLFYDTDFLQENRLYTVTSTVYWYSAKDFGVLDSKPLNNTKTTYFYVLGEGAIENLPETNAITVILSLIFVLFILIKK